MDKKMTAMPKSLGLKKRGLIIIVALLIVAIVILLLFLLHKPERSVVSYCKVYKEENAKLANSHGDTYSVAVFSHSSSDPTDFVNAFSRLEQVSPDEIQSDVKTLHQVFQKIKDDPSQATSASLSGLGAESSVKQWTDNHCGN